MTAISSSPAPTAAATTAAGRLGKIVLAFDSFKGSASSAELASAARRAIRALLPECDVRVLPIADGGEGTVEAICRHTDAHAVDCTVHDPLMRPIAATYRVSADGSTAFMEMAAASGLTLLDPDERNPEVATTYGTGEMMAHALAHGCTTIVLGIGGSATNDAAVGALSALGFRFADASGAPTARLASIATVDASGCMAEARRCRLRVICDVNNPLYGERGAACVYAPQKGADPAMVARLDQGLRNFAAVARRQRAVDLQAAPGAGAAGGMGGGLLAYLGATLEPGIDTVLDMVGFSDMLDGAALVITGEGRIDAQTAMGKAVDGVARKARERGVPVVALAGSVAPEADADALGLDALLSIQPGPRPAADAMRKSTTLRNVERTVAQIVRIILATQK